MSVTIAREIRGSAYCCAFAESHHAAADLAENGRVLVHDVFDKKGNQIGSTQKPNPAIAQVRKARLEMRAYANEFGMTPVSSATDAIRWSFEKSMKVCFELGSRANPSSAEKGDSTLLA